MRQTLNGMRKRGSEDRGFTMIELLVVVVIIGVLVAIAVPVYLNYRKGAANKSAASDVRGAITAVEQYYTDNGNAYPAGVDLRSADNILEFAAVDTSGSPQKITVSPGNELAYTNTSVAGGEASYRICAVNQDGGQIYVYDSTQGGSVAKSNADNLADCVGG
jgi:type IV pilus assembly protein PilA